VLVIIELRVVGTFRSLRFGTRRSQKTGEAEWPTSNNELKPKSPACVDTLAR
jgi:hypothetical protein